MKNKIPRREKPKDKLNFTLAFTNEDMAMLSDMRAVANMEDRPLGNWLRVRLRELYNDNLLFKEPAK